MSRFPLDLPSDAKAWVRTRAKASGRSQNSEIVWILKQAMAADPAVEDREETGASVSQTSAPAPRVNPEDRI